MKTLSFGSIGKSRFYLGFEWHPWSSAWFVSFGPTYNGTKRGIFAQLWHLTLIAHTR